MAPFLVGLYFPMNMSGVLSYIIDIVQEWERLGMALQIPYEILKEIDTDKTLVASKKEEMIVKWMDSPGPACWWLLVKVLEEIDQNVAAAAIRTEQGSSLTKIKHNYIIMYLARNFILRFFCLMLMIS